MTIKALNNKNEYEDRIVYNTNEIDFSIFSLNTVKKKKIEYLENFITFDIETTTFQYGLKATKKPDYLGMMYVWQVAFNDNYVVIGRTWTDFIQLLDTLKDNLKLSENKKMVIYVHNLSYEFQFIKDFFDWSDIFATAPHKVLKASTDCFEFRCAYLLTNMNLKKFLENEQTHLIKAVEDLDYKIFRDSETELTAVEYGYCYNDVAGLYEAINKLMKSENDNITTIPMTSTGYVRRDLKRTCNRNKRYYFKYIKDHKLEPYHYKLLKEAFRGGNTASNVRYVEKELKNVISFDFSSSYPTRIIKDYFPMSAWFEMRFNNLKSLDYYLNNYCCLMNIAFYDLKLKEDVAIPYISKSKCRIALNEDVTTYNGRVLTSNYVEMCITELDFKIIKKQYDFSKFAFIDDYILLSKKGKLPKEIINKTYEYFDNKTKLKGFDDYYYSKSKALLNAIYGMCVTDICYTHFIINTDGEWIEKRDKTIQQSIDEYYNSFTSFLNYDWGVWICAHARYALQELIDLFNNDIVYCDTDSVKVITERKKAEKMIKNYNDNLLKEIKENNLKMTSEDIKGNKHTLGLAEFDGFYPKFKTLGAKKYVYEDDNKNLHITIAGVPKERGAIYLQNRGGIKQFRKGFIFKKIKTAIQYNNEVKDICYNDKCYHITSNIALYDDNYTLDFTFDINDILTIIYNKGDVEYE